MYSWGPTLQLSRAVRRRLELRDMGRTVGTHSAARGASRLTLELRGNDRRN
jgi:hypothetical protein